MGAILRWAPRLSAIGAALFLGLFGLDAFRPGAPLGEALLAFAIHSIPALVLAAVLVLAWRRPLAGGLACLALAAIPFIALSNPVWVNAMLAGPVAFAGALFVLDGVRRGRV